MNKRTTKQTIIQASKRLGQFTIAVVFALVCIWGMTTCLQGCVSSNGYVMSKEPTLILRGEGRIGTAPMLYFTITNPTSQRKHYLLKCLAKDTTAMHFVSVIVNPRSDAHARIGLMPGSTTQNYDCFLEADTRPGSLR